MPLSLRLLRFALAILPIRSVRRKLWHHAKNFVYGFQARKRGKVGIGVDFVGPTSVNRQTTIGDFSVICGLSIPGDGSVTIGRNCHIAPEVLILAQNHDYDDGIRIPYGDESHEKPVLINDFAWIGQRATILPGTTIGEGAIIQAGAVVHGTIPPMAIAGGNPAKVFSSRNVARFKDMKERGCYAR